jgi:hypothetical protein
MTTVFRYERGHSDDGSEEDDLEDSMSEIDIQDLKEQRKTQVAATKKREKTKNDHLFSGIASCSAQDFDNYLETKVRCPVSEEIEEQGRKLFPKSEGHDDFVESKPIDEDEDMEEFLEPEILQSKLTRVFTDDERILDMELSENWIEALKQIYFPEIKHFYHSNFNILIYGVGSKYEILEHLEKEITVSGGVLKVVVNGYHPGAMFKGILNKITSYINKHLVSKINSSCIQAKFSNIGS